VLEPEADKRIKDQHVVSKIILRGLAVPRPSEIALRTVASRRWVNRPRHAERQPRNPRGDTIVVVISLGREREAR
jgi:hypothetical protein